MYYLYILKLNNMATKTFKIGEYCTGGIITVTTTGKIIKIENKEWDFSTGSRRSSDQSNAKVLSTGTIDNNPHDQVYRKVYEYLVALTTSYYADEIIKWIESKVGRLNRGFGGW
jgi:hypothetical protein